MAISFSNNNIQFRLKKKSSLKEWIKGVAKKEKKEVGGISYIFTTDEELLKVNIEYLNHNTFTDIITFDYSENKKINGEIIISVERIKENAEKFEVEFEDELHRVMIHGILHLCGYKDKTKSDSDLMRKKENAALRLLKNKN